MPLPILPIVVCLLGAAAYHQSNRKERGPGKGILTPERQNIYDMAIKDLQDPEKLRLLAKTFREQDLPVQADMLEKRAALRELPNDIKQARRDAFKRAMKSTDANAVRKLANAFDLQGASGAAYSLREYAATLPAVPVDVTPVQPAPPPEPIQAIQVEEAEDDSPNPNTLTEHEITEE